jgi:hypothetical protein
MNANMDGGILASDTGPTIAMIRGRLERRKRYLISCEDNVVVVEKLKVG